MTTVTPAQFAALRAALDGDEETVDRLTVAPGFLDGGGFPILIVTALVAAAQRRFPPGWSGGDVVRLVGRVRARNGSALEGLSATATEQMLLSILRGVLMGGEFDEVTKGIAQVALLTELVSDLNEQELSLFLSEARDQADVWLAQHGHR
jgi:hypothetical protein